MRRTLGTAVFSGMLGVTLFGIFLTPVFFYVIDWLGETPLFASPAAPRFDRLRHASGVLTLGLRGGAVVLLRRPASRAARAGRRPDRAGTAMRTDGPRPAHPTAYVSTRSGRPGEPHGAEVRSYPMFSQVLHRPADLRLGAVDRHHPGRRHRRLFTLPVAQYPGDHAADGRGLGVYPGANAQVVADTVAAPIEQQVNGVEDMMYMSSQCTNDGTYTLTVTFKPGVDLNMAQVLVQNRVSLAEPILPDLVKRRGVTVKKKSPSVLMIVNLFSPDDSRDNLYLSNYATIQLRDELSRLPGVGDITYLGQRDYSMRVWLDPEKMAFRNLTASDVVQAIEQQNIQVAAGQIGQPPVADRAGRSSTP